MQNTQTATTTTQVQTPIGGQNQRPDRSPKPLDNPGHAEAMLKIVAKRSFCTLATTSDAGWSHAAGVVYQAVDSELWIHTTVGSRKARNVASSGRVGVGLAFRRLPVGPPYTIHYQARAELVAMDDPAAVRLVEAGTIDKVAGHGALDMADGCFIKVSRPRTLHSYGPGARIIDLIRWPLNNGAMSVSVPKAEEMIR